MMTSAGQRHGLFEHRPPSRLRLLHQKFKELVAVIRLEKRSQFFAGVVARLCQTMLRNALGHFDALRPKKKIAQKPPCFAGFFDF